MPGRLRRSLEFACSLLLALPGLTAAQQNQGAAVVTVAGARSAQVVVSDGAGGAIVAWQDYRSGATYDIYAQHMLASGVPDPAWPVGGRGVCTAGGEQVYPVIVADGNGGAIIAWQDFRSGSYDVYAQHVLSSGLVDGAWPYNGQVLCSAPFDQVSLAIVVDGTGGAIVAWENIRNGSGHDIYAQHVLPAGVVGPAWPVDGRALCTAGNNQVLPASVSDGAGGAIVTWQDVRTGASDIYARHVFANGTTDPAWPSNGLPVCIAIGEQSSPKIAGDGLGGAIVTWQDNRSGPADIYAQHVLPSGADDPSWPANGRALCTAPNDQESPTIAADGSGGAVVAWEDDRDSGWDIYAQHVKATGHALGPVERHGQQLRDVAGWRWRQRRRGLWLPAGAPDAQLDLELGQVALPVVPSRRL